MDPRTKVRIISLFLTIAQIGLLIHNSIIVYENNGEYVKITGKLTSILFKKFWFTFCDLLHFIFRRNIGQLFHPNGNYNWNLLLGHFCESFGLMECWKFESMVDNPMADFLFSNHFLLYLCFTSNRHLVRLDSTWTYLGTFESSYSFCCFDLNLFLDCHAKVFCLGLWRKIIVY